jgi:hypothetical protein
MGPEKVKVYSMLYVANATMFVIARLTWGVDQTGQSDDV